jgi:hypothetical protein
MDRLAGLNDIAFPCSPDGPFFPSHRVTCAHQRLATDLRSHWDGRDWPIPVGACLQRGRRRSWVRRRFR